MEPVSQKNKQFNGSNTLGLNTDQHEISPCIMDVYSTSEVMRIKDMTTQGEFSCTSLQYF